MHPGRRDLTLMPKAAFLLAAETFLGLDAEIDAPYRASNEHKGRHSVARWLGSSLGLLHRIDGVAPAKDLRTGLDSYADIWIAEPVPADLGAIPSARSAVRGAE